MKVVIYCRVSTEEQELSQQIASCKRFCEYRDFEVATVYAEIASGAKAKRPQYLQMVAGLRDYKYDGVVVFRLDRLGRNARELVMLIEELEGKGIKVLSIHESFDTSTPIGRFQRDIIVSLAQLEREQIGEATKQRLQALKAMGKRLGQKPKSVAQVRRVRRLHVIGLSLRLIARNASLSYGTVYNIVNRRGYYADHHTGVKL